MGCIRMRTLYIRPCRAESLWAGTGLSGLCGGRALGSGLRAGFSDQTILVPINCPPFSELDWQFVKSGSEIRMARDTGRDRQPGCQFGVSALASFLGSSVLATCHDRTGPGRESTRLVSGEVRQSQTSRTITSWH